MKIEKNQITDDIKIIKEKSDFLGFIALLWRDKKQIIIITIVFAFFGLITVLLLKPWYKSKVTIMPTSRKGNNPMSKYAGLASIVGINLPSGMNDNPVLVYPYIINSNYILDQILKKKFRTKKYKNLVTLYEFWNEDIDSTEENWEYKLVEESKKKLREDYINVDIDEETDIIEIFVATPDDPLLSAEIANFIVERVEVYNKHYRKYKAEEQIAFINKGIEETKTNLEDIENKYKNFMELHKETSSPQLQIELGRIQTEWEVQKIIYIEQRKQLEISKIDLIKESETLNIIDNAVPPIKKFKPKRLIIVIAIMLLGFLLSVFHASLKKYWRTNRNNFKELL